MSNYHPDSDLPDEKAEGLEHELKTVLGKIAACGAALEGFLTATEAKLDDPIEQRERERQREATQEAIAGVADDFAELRRELRSALGQPHNEPSDDSTQHQ